MRLSIKAQLRILLGFFALVLLTLTVAVWWDFDTVRRLQDDGAEAARRAQSAADAANIGPVLYRIIADGEINLNLENTRKDWAETLAKQREIARHVTGWATSPKEAALAQAGSAAIEKLAGVFEREMLPALEASDVMTQAIRDLDGRIDEIIDEIKDPFTELKTIAVDDARSVDTEFDVEATRGQTVTAAVMLATLLITLGGSLYIDRRISNGVTNIITAMSAIAGGRLDTTIAGRERPDEFGRMASELETMRQGLADAEQLRHSAQDREAAEREVLARREQLARVFVDQMRTLAQDFVHSSGEVAAAARGLSATAEETSRQAQAVAAAAEQASANVQTVAASSEEMAASVHQINDQVARSANVADSAYAEAQESNRRISELASAASAIGDVVGMIDSIAAQTNLLALNATIEAARAGEAGRGFAVVASEVKELASQTAKATKDISGKIGEMQQETEGTVSSMAEILRVISTIKENASQISGAVEQQGVATAEIAQNCQQAATGTQQVTQNITGVGRAAEMTGSASTQLLGLSSALSERAGDLRTAVEGFVKDFAAA